MPDINFKLLHIFIAIADNRSFRQASEKLNRSQSAVSMQIKQLEDQIGAALFHRTTRRVELTAEGSKLLTFARRALGEWENGLREIREAVDIQRGTLTFACIPTIAATILPRGPMLAVKMPTTSWMIQSANSTLTTSQKRAPKLWRRSSIVIGRPATACASRCR